MDTTEKVYVPASGLKIEQHRAFLSWLFEWKEQLPSLTLQKVISEAGGAGKVAITCVDMTRGFCHEGALASPRVAALERPIATLFVAAHAAGVRHFLLPQDNHEPDAPEFAQFPPHCIVGTPEAETVRGLGSLPFADIFHILPKNSISASANTGLDAALEKLDAAGVTTYVAVGDCTDLCVYQMVMHLKLRANARNKKVRIIAPATLIQTYDLPVNIAQDVGALPHDGDLLHGMFLYHMALNGIEVVANLA